MGFCKAAEQGNKDQRAKEAGDVCEAVAKE